VNISPVNIDFEVMRYAVRKYAKEKAVCAGSTIIYVENGRLIEEEPVHSQKKVLKNKSSSQ
jgi:hypothetical protein